MIIERCTCRNIAVRSSREAEPGAELVDVTDADGRWHAVKVGETVYRQQLIEPTPAKRAEHVAIAEVCRQSMEAEEAKLTAVAELRAKRGRGERLTPADLERAVDVMLGM